VAVERYCVLYNILKLVKSELSIVAATEIYSNLLMLN